MKITQERQRTTNTDKIVAFNHYAKIKRILEDYYESDWYIVQVNKPTSSKRFNGETLHYPHYYRIYYDGQPVKYCKFQQLDRLAAILKVDVAFLIMKMCDEDGFVD